MTPAEKRVRAARARALLSTTTRFSGILTMALPTTAGPRTEEEGGCGGGHGRHRRGTSCTLVALSRTLAAP